MHGFADAITEDVSLGCQLTTNVGEADYSVDTHSGDSNCFDATTSGTDLVLSTNLVFYDGSNNRPFSSVNNQLN